jgi:flagellar basal body-associated protein FliL
MADEAQPVSEPKPKKRGVVFGALVVVLAGLGLWSWSALKSAPRVAADADTRTKATLHLESFVLNLADSDQKAYLRVGIDLGLGRELGKNNPPPVAQVRDTILGVLSQGKVDDLLTVQGKEKLKRDLLQALSERVPELEVREIYYTEFLIQR